METKELWPCMLAGDCAQCCVPPELRTFIATECYLTTMPGLKVRGDCDCKLLDDGTFAISYPTYGAEKDMLYEIVALLGQQKAVTFRQIHYICTNEQPGPVTSSWPLIWNGLVQIDDDKLTFEFIGRTDTDD